MDNKKLFLKEQVLSFKNNEKQLERFRLFNIDD